MDIALLTVNTGEFFKKIEFQMDIHLKRLKWVNKARDKLTGRPPTHKTSEKNYNFGLDQKISEKGGVIVFLL